MKAEYLPSFIKDLKALKGSPNYEKIKALVFEGFSKLHSIDKVMNLKKLKGYKQFYRIRVGEYRVGVRLEKDKVVFMRVLHRKDIYRYFP